jgi:casein kinase 1
MQLLGKSLENMFTFCNKKFSVRCVCNLGYQMVEILKYVHDKHIIHQDIKPDNFVTSYEDKKSIYLLDFGLARKYRSSTTLKHYPKLENKTTGQNLLENEAYIMSYLKGRKNNI